MNFELWLNGFEKKVQLDQILVCDNNLIALRKRFGSMNKIFVESAIIFCSLSIFVWEWIKNLQIWLFKKILLTTSETETLLLKL